MPSRQDQLHSYRFAVQRVVSALVAHETDPAEAPFRRTNGAVLASVMLAVLALMGAAAFGAITGEGPVRFDKTAMFIEKDTFAKYVYYEPDGKLHPVLNYSSALLIVGSPEIKAQTWSRKKLAQAQLGAPMGIPGAPDSLPGAADLLTGPWTLCARVVADAGTPQSVLAVGERVAGGYPLTAPRPGAVADALLVSAPDATVYLVYGNRKFLIPRPGPVQAALGWSKNRPVPVAAALLNALPTGPNIEAPSIAGAGAASSAAPGRVGQLVRAPEQGQGSQWAVVLDDGIVYLSDLQAALLRDDPPIRARPLEVDTARFGRLPESKVGLGSAAEALPASIPKLVNVSGSVCVQTRDATEAVSAVIVDPEIPEGPAGTGTAPQSGVGATTADRVSVARGHAVVVEAAASPDAPRGSGALSVVTDAGLRYPVAHPDVLASLGYGGVTPQRMPAELVALIPTGPALDPAAATAVG